MRPAPTRERLFRSGIRRIGPKRAFRYRHADQRPVAQEHIARIKALAIPPAWRDVAIAPSPGARVQAIGRDQAGRWQYLYHRAHTEHRSRRKFDRLAAFGLALPALRRALNRDLRLPGLPLEKAQACAVLLLAACAIRPGAAEYARDNGTFGLATLRTKHVDIHGDRIRLRFRGKHGVIQNHEIRSRTLSGLLKTMKRMPGKELLKYQNADGSVCDLRRRHVNAYVKQAMGERFTARDFRTWSGTLLCAASLHRRLERCARPRERERAILEALDDTAGQLGNTRAVVRGSYVHPQVLESFRRGQVVSHSLARLDRHVDKGRVALHRYERALLALLRSGRSGRRASHVNRASRARRAA
jgi:DNA topoisomerase-1